MGRIKVMPPLSAEIQAYTLARFSRSPDTIDESLAWVQQHDEQAFLDSYYFQYGHSSIADLGNLTLSFEGVSELAALEIVDDPLWNGQQNISADRRTPHPAIKDFLRPFDERGRKTDTSGDRARLHDLIAEILQINIHYSSASSAQTFLSFSFRKA